MQSGAAGLWRLRGRFGGQRRGRCVGDPDEEFGPLCDEFEEELVQVRVVRAGLGRIATEHGGSVELDLGTTHYLPRGDVEHLVRQGALLQLDGEENT